MTVGRICVRNVDLADATETVQAAAQRMHSRNVGTLLVVDSEQHPQGIITDRDLCIRVVGESREPVATTVGEVMTECPTCIGEETPIEAAITLMRSGPFRRLPVVDCNGELVGLVSLDDILDLLTEEFRDIGELLAGESPRSLAQP
ncbi:MAG: CBS domain-containing protein [Pirellulales bacterium]